MVKYCPNGQKFSESSKLSEKIKLFPEINCLIKFGNQKISTHQFSLIFLICKFIRGSSCQNLLQILCRLHCQLARYKYYCVKLSNHSQLKLSNPEYQPRRQFACIFVSCPLSLTASSIEQFCTSCTRVITNVKLCSMTFWNFAEMLKFMNDWIQAVTRDLQPASLLQTFV